MTADVQGSIVAAPEDAVFVNPKDRHARLLEAAARRRKYEPNERTDAIIREAYRRLLIEKDRTATKWAQQQTGWPKHIVCRRAAALGLSRVKEPNWQPRELEILQEHAHLGADAIRRRLAAEGFRRSRGGIILKPKRLKLTKHLDGYSGNALADLFGVDNHVIYRWIELGKLAAVRRETRRSQLQGGDSYWIRRVDVQAFLFEHPDEYDLRKVEKWWFLSVLTGGRISR
jgi:hypothetical protein